MVYIVNDFSREGMTNLLNEIKRKNKKKHLSGRAMTWGFKNSIALKGKKKMLPSILVA